MTRLGLQGPISEDQIKDLVKLTKLQKLHFNPYGFCMNAVANQFPELEELRIDVGSDRLGALARLKHLRHLTCEGNQLEKNLDTLKKVPIETLTLYSGMTDKQVALLGELDNLRNIEIAHFHSDGTRLSDEAWSAISKLPNLEYISAHHHIDSPTDQVLLNWAKAPMLRKVSLEFVNSRRKYTPEGIASFRKLRPDVHLWIDGQEYNNDVIPFLVIQKLDETDPLPAWNLPKGSPSPVVAPCEPQLATELQKQWAEFLRRPVMEERAGLGMKFALIPPGEFRKIFMRPRNSVKLHGDPAIERDKPVRRFRITKPYAISNTEVTWDQFRQFVDATGYKTEAELDGLGGRQRNGQTDPKINWRNPGWTPDPNEPVTQVSPKDAEAFCAWLSDSESKSQKSPSKTYYRLPTQAEWLHACRAGSVYKYVVGPDPQDLTDSEWTSEFQNPDPAANPMHVVGQKKPNPFGLYDLLGNVKEYVRDSLTLAVMPYLPTNDPVGGGVPSEMGRSWYHSREIAHPNNFELYGGVYPDKGFRVVKQLYGKPLAGPLDRPLVLQPGQPLSVHALVSRPEKIPGLRSWSVELAGPQTPSSEATAASPLGNLVATANYLGKISLWDTKGNYRRALLGHEGQILSLDLSADGRWLASCERIAGDRGSGEVTARLWNVETGVLQAVYPLDDWPIRIRFSPDGNHLAVSGPNNGRPGFAIFDLVTGGCRKAPNSHSGLAHGCAWSPDGTKFACSHGDQRLRVWDAKTLAVLAEADAFKSHALEWSPNGHLLAMQNSDRQIDIRDAKSLEVVQKCGASTIGYQHSIAWLPDSQRIVIAGEDPECAVFDVTTGEQTAKLELGHGAFALLKDGKKVVFEKNGRLHFFDSDTGKLVLEGVERANPNGATALSPSGDYIFCSPSADRLDVFDAVTGTKIKQVVLSSPSWASGRRTISSPNGSILAIGNFEGFDSVVQLIDFQTGGKQHELSHGDGKPTAVTWSPDGTLLATGATDSFIRIWNASSGKLEHQLAGHAGTIWSLAWSPDGTRLASAGQDKTIYLWNPHDGKLLASHDKFPEELTVKVGYGNPRNELAWSADSHQLWIALSQNIVPLDVDSGSFGPMEDYSNGNVIAFLNQAPNGSRLLAREAYEWTLLRDRDGQDRRILGQYLGCAPQWHPDCHRILGSDGAPGSYATVAFDVDTNRRLGRLFPWLTGDHWLCIGPTGHYRGSEGVESQIVYVAMHEDGSQRTYTPAEFAEKFSWKNAPEKAELLGK